jgi:hypothetical protein
MIPDPIAVRVFRRHAARTGAVLFRDVPVPRTRVEYTDGGTISAIALGKMLEPTLGPLMSLRFLALDGPPTTIAWAVVTEGGNVVSGRLVLHTAVAEDEVISWAEVEITQ